MISLLPGTRLTVPTEVSKAILHLTQNETGDLYFQEIQCCENGLCKNLFEELLKLLWIVHVTSEDFVFPENYMNATREATWDRQKWLVFWLL